MKRWIPFMMVMCGLWLGVWAQAGQEPQRLEANKPLEREITGGQTHTYQFVVYALNVATVPNLTMTSNQTAARDAIVMPSRVLASGALTGTSNASRP